MGYACPVCDDPQQDAEHLANHLAFQALTHGDDHETWLDEHTSGWAEGGPADLAPRLEELASEAEYEVVFEDTSPDRSDKGYDPDDQRPGSHEHSHAHGHDHSHGHGHGSESGTFETIDTDDLGPDAQDIVAEAQELTREMLSGEEGGDEGEGESGDERGDDSDDSDGSNDSDGEET